jgi:7-cyano-7-deazaguanine synthase
MANAIYIGSYMRVRLITPLMWMDKGDVVITGSEFMAPYHLTMSCYEGVEPACGICPTCVARLNAFAAAKIADPIPYAPEAIRVDVQASAEEIERSVAPAISFHSGSA